MADNSRCWPHGLILDTCKVELTFLHMAALISSFLLYLCRLTFYKCKGSAILENESTVKLVSTKTGAHSVMM